MASSTVAIVLSAVAVGVSVLSFINAHRARREAGWRVRVRWAMTTGGIDDPSCEIAVWLSNAGRAEVEITRARLIFRRGQLTHNYETLTEPACVIEGGHSAALALGRSVSPLDPKLVKPKDGQFGLVVVKLGSGRTMRRIVRLKYGVPPPSLEETVL